MWFNVQDLNVADAGGSKVDLGTIATNSARGLSDHKTPAKDLDGFTKSAEVGIGGMATSLDGRAMFIANLHDKAIYGIPLPLDDPGATPGYAVKIPTPVGDNQQLWALSTYKGRLYLGYVDTGIRPGQSASSAGLKAYVVSIPLKDAVDSVVRASAGRPHLASRDHRRPGIRQGLQHGELADPGRRPESAHRPASTGNPVPAHRPSTPRSRRSNGGTPGPTAGPGTPRARAVDTDDPFDSAVQAGGGTVGLPGGCGYGTGWEQAYAQPVLSGITFDIDGYMILGFTDRSALQSGNRNFAAISTVTTGRYWESISNGDTLIAAPSALVDRRVPSGCPGADRSELRAGVQGPGRSAARSAPPRPARRRQNPTYSNNEGPGGGEFLNDRRDQGTGGNHNENTLGSVVTYPGVDEIASSAMDPYSGINRNGLMWFDQNTGVATRGFDQVVGDQNNQSSTFQKGGGLGSTALLGVAAPVEIGNRVWLDADLNGRQDPDEPAINGAPVQLWTADPASPDTPVCKIGETKTATLDAQPGTYYFRSDDSTCRTSPATGMTPSASSPTPTTCSSSRPVTAWSSSADRMLVIPGSSV